MLNGVNLEIREGEFFFLLGPSGCGKTTLLRILAGLMHPDSGQVLLQGTDITHVPAYKRDINTVFQNYALFPHMNVFDNIAFGLRMKKTPESEIASRVTDALKLVNLPDFADRRSHQMSGGQMQRVALARAIVNEPAVLLLDEPLGALDVKLRKQMQLELRRIQRKLGKTFVCVTHDQEEALTLGDRIAVMNHGNIEQIGTADELYNRPNSFFVCDFLGECNFIRNADYRVEGNLVVIPFENTVINATEIATKPTSAKVIVGIRPEKISISKKATSANTANTANTAKNSISTTVTEVIFTGNQFTIVTRTVGGQDLRATIPNNSHFDKPEIGIEVQLEWNTSDTILMGEHDE